MKKSKLALIIIVVLIVSSLATYFVLDTLDKKNEVSEDVNGTEDQDTDKSIEDGDAKWRSPISGKKTTKKISKKRPVAVMFDNHPMGRPQSGLSKAEIVYEFPVENPYTRYVGIFLLDEPKSIGPIRSTRPYFVQTIASYDPIYVRCGGSEAGKDEVKRHNISDVDCLSHNEAFSRIASKKAPHNLYTTMEKIRKQQEKLGYSEEANYEGYKFNETDKDIKGTSGEIVDIKYNDSNNTRYEYNKAEKNYKRYKDGRTHIDEIDNSDVVAKNIIIQQAESRIIDNEGRKEIDITGKGKGIYITNGTMKNISWEKSSPKNITIYSDDEGEISLNSGVTWIQVVSPQTKINIK